MSCPELPQEGASSDATETNGPVSKKPLIDAGVVLGEILGVDPKEIVRDEPFPPSD